MSEKRKNMTIDELQAFINDKSEADKEQQANNAWKLHNDIMKKLAEGKVSVNRDKSITVELRFWRGGLWDYDQDALEGMLKANGLALSDTGRQGWQGWNTPFPGQWFSFTLVIVSDSEERAS